AKDLAPARAAPLVVSSPTVSPAKQHPRGLQEIAQQLQELLQPVVVHPMAGALDRDDPGVAKMRQPPVLFRIGSPGPALLAVEEEGRAADPAPQFLDLVAGHPIGRV